MDVLKAGRVDLWEHEFHFPLLEDALLVKVELKEEVLQTSWGLILLLYALYEQLQGVLEAFRQFFATSPRSVVAGRRTVHLVVCDGWQVSTRSTLIHGVLQIGQIVA